MRILIAFAVGFVVVVAATVWVLIDAWDVDSLMVWYKSEQLDD
jgi:hypothetical protein